jgi:hypothetical protein
MDFLILECSAWTLFTFFLPFDLSKMVFNRLEQPSAELIMVGEQMEILYQFQQDAMDMCRTKCVNADLRMGELTTAEKTCTDRCLSKFFDANKLVQAAYVEEMTKQRTIS